MFLWGNKNNIIWIIFLSRMTLGITFAVAWHVLVFTEQQGLDVFIASDKTLFSTESIDIFLISP